MDLHGFIRWARGGGKLWRPTTSRLSPTQKEKKGLEDTPAQLAAIRGKEKKKKGGGKDSTPYPARTIPGAQLRRRKKKKEKRLNHDRVPGGPNCCAR